MSVLNQQAVEFRQRLDGGLGGPQRQARTSCCVQHPAGNGDDDARRHLDMNDLTDGSSLSILQAHPLAVQRVPPVVDLEFLPDMGRMTAQ